MKSPIFRKKFHINIYIFLFFFYLNVILYNIILEIIEILKRKIYKVNVIVTLQLGYLVRTGWDIGPILTQIAILCLYSIYIIYCNFNSRLSFAQKIKKVTC